MAKYVLEDVADFVVVGTGAGGATAARVLSAAGHSVLMLEEGGWLHTPDQDRSWLGRIPARSLKLIGWPTTASKSMSSFWLVATSDTSKSDEIRSVTLKWRTSSVSPENTCWR